MDRLKLNYWIDAAMACSLIITVISSIVLFFILPSGRFAGREVILGLARYQWNTLHSYVGLIFVALMIAHLSLHCKWLVAMTKQVFGKRSTDK